MVIKKAGKPMKKLFCIILGLVVIMSCGTKRSRIDKIYEEGVEVVSNHREPYAVATEPTDFKIEEELTIDFGSPEIGEMGIADATDFTVDAKGFIYFMLSHKKGDLIFKFGPDGKFNQSWARKGQGPGELQFIIGACITSAGNLIISDQVGQKLVWFTEEGRLLKEARYPVDGRYFIIYPIDENRFVGFAQATPGDPKADSYPNVDSFSDIFYLLDRNLSQLKKLDVYKYPNPMKKGRRAINPNNFFTARPSTGCIFLGNEDRGYEILKFDLNGNLLRKIRKEYTPVRVPGETMKKRKASYGKYPGTYYFPDYYLPICDFFPDENNRLFVMTFEKGPSPGEYWYDIFDSDGLFIRRKPLHILSWGEIAACAQATRSRLYCFQEREDGYRAFKVYKLVWD
jgi:hypothetical protein